MKDIITLRHIDNMAKILLATGMMVGFAYSMEFFIAWYGANEYELYCFKNRAFGPYWWAYWAMISCNVVSPQLFWFRACRTNVAVVFMVSFFVTIGMWFERFVIIVSSLHRAFLPGEWGMFHPTAVDIGIFVGSFGVFMTLFLLFLRFLPAFPIAEIKAVLPQASPHHGHGHGGHGHGDHAHDSHAHGGSH
jgi:molybdopterin-containing oxidoreductase family membrane subunit